jgi:hypothetical protein
MKVPGAFDAALQDIDAVVHTAAVVTFEGSYDGERVFLSSFFGH